jgi:hypothetical protein
MEVYAQEITASCDEGCEEDRRDSESLCLVYPKVLLVGYSKRSDREADLKRLYVVLETQEGLWAMVQASDPKGTGKSYMVCKVDR